MERNVKYIWIGAVFFIIFACAIVFIMWLSRYEVDTSRYAHYYAYSVEELSGVYVNTPIRYKGITVGRVMGVKFRDIKEGTIEIEMIVDSRLVLREGAMVVVSSQGLAGANYLAIMQGFGETISANEEGRKVLELEKGSIDRILSKAGELGEEATILLKNFNHTLSRKNLDEVANMARELNIISSNLRILTEQINQNMQKGEYNMREILAPTLVQMQGSLQDMSKFFKEASALIQKIDKNPYDSLFGRVDSNKANSKEQQ